MDFRLELHIKPWKQQLNLKHSIMLMGSCFTEHMSERFAHYRFNILENPNGILFNPVSIAGALQDYVAQRQCTVSDIFQYEGLWQSWDHHGRFASLNPEATLTMMNEEYRQAAEFLRSTHWLIITLGSSFIYELREATPYGDNDQPRPVANCHKVPAQHFIHRLLSQQEVDAALAQMVTTVRSVNPGVKIIFTISPVRHSREGLVENNRSKGRLHTAVGELVEQEENIFYFPSYELIIDDLRDYRFFAEDLVHPNYFATRYVWEKFANACIDEDTRTGMEKIKRINAAMHHRPRQPQSEQHKAFLLKMYKETAELAFEYPFLYLDDALQYFQPGKD